MKAYLLEVFFTSGREMSEALPIEDGPAAAPTELGEKQIFDVLHQGFKNGGSMRFGGLDFSFEKAEAATVRIIECDKVKNGKPVSYD